MRTNLLRGLGVSTSVVLSVLSLASYTSAQAATTPVSTTTSGKHAALENLHKAHRLLVTADHDYDGHRARSGRRSP